MTTHQKFRAYLRHRLFKFLELNEYDFVKFPNLNHSVLEVNNLTELLKYFGWQVTPILDDPIFHEFKYSEDLNERRIRDAESLGAVAMNINPNICVDIGTAQGHSAALIAVNAPASTVYTVNILPEEIESGSGGILTTGSYSQEEIGSYYKQRGVKNIRQIFINTAAWEPNIGIIDLAYIDGSHDTDFVYNDTKIMLKQMKPGSIILWHDFNLDLAPKYDWINQVCLGVEKLYRDGYLKGRIFHLRDSWVGIYRVD